MLTSATRGETLTPNPNECNSTLTSVTRGTYPYPDTYIYKCSLVVWNLGSPHLGHMVSGHMPTVPASFSSHPQSSATTLASFSAPGDSSLSTPAGNSTSWASFPPQCPAGVSASSSSSGAVSLASFSLTHSTWTNSAFPHVPVSSTASLASFSVANAPSRPASVSCRTSSSTGTTFSVSNLPGIFPTQVCVSQSSGLSCPHPMQSASIPVPQQQCYYIPSTTSLYASYIQSPVSSSVSSCSALLSSDSLSPCLLSPLHS